mmetsp:Transcript_9390/g.26330  ORF Transcript_9390/g.26330 Transcript_9390/m.26330 type:complete len:369 (-) Transcript_9390:25-1131(-)
MFRHVVRRQWARKGLAACALSAKRLCLAPLPIPQRDVIEREILNRILRGCEAVGEAKREIGDAGGLSRSDAPDPATAHLHRRVDLGRGHLVRALASQGRTQRVANRRAEQCAEAVRHRTREGAQVKWKGRPGCPPGHRPDPVQHVDVRPGELQAVLARRQFASLEAGDLQQRQRREGLLARRLRQVHALVPLVVREAPDILEDPLEHLQRLGPPRVLQDGAHFREPRPARSALHGLAVGQADAACALVQLIRRPLPPQALGLAADRRLRARNGGGPNALRELERAVRRADEAHGREEFARLGVAQQPTLELCAARVQPAELQLCRVIGDVPEDLQEQAQDLLRLPARRRAELLQDAVGRHRWLRRGSF